MVRVIVNVVKEVKVVRAVRVVMMVSTVRAVRPVGAVRVRVRVVRVHLSGSQPTCFSSQGALADQKSNSGTTTKPW